MSVTVPPLTAAVDAEAVWLEFHERLLGFIERRVRSRETAEDILQDMMLRIHRGAGELERVEAVGGWVHEIARNAIIDHYRSARVRRERPAGMEIDREQAAEPEDETDVRGELSACVAPLLRRLPASYREALELTELEGMTQADAAARLGLSVSGMKSRVQRGRVQLKRVLTDCCEIERDRTGGLTAYQPRRGPCDCAS